MNILFISKLSGNMWAGPNNSVPEQIRAQSKIDNCFWYNLNTIKRKEWEEDGLNCKNLNDFPTKRIKDLPDPFNHPDIAVVEEVYCYPFDVIIKELIKSKIPYVIVPRSTLTKQAQANKAVKKQIGNLLWFNRMVFKASAIHYLTEEEKKESQAAWNNASFIVPNGIKGSNYKHVYTPKTGIDAVYIGRIEIYQKGFDLLLEAIKQCKDKLMQVSFHLSIYGPNRDGACEQINLEIQKHSLNSLITIHGPVFGEEKEKVLKEADAFVMTSRFEGLPMGLIEALSYGLPCLITRGSNLMREIVEAKAGWGAENSVNSIANALLQMVDDIKKYSIISENALKLSKEFSWESIAKQSHDQYKAILGRE